MGLQKPLVVLDAIPSDALTCLVLTNAIFDEKQLKKICRFTNLRRVEFCGTEVTDDSIGCLASLPQLEAIDVTRTRVHGRFLLDFSQSKKLKLLYMSHNEIERKYLPALKNLPNLSRLILNSVRLIDADMAIIGSCSQLEFLDIAGNAALTNKCLVDLKRLKRLHILEIPYTKLTARDLLQLKGLPLVSLRIQPGQGSTADMDALKKQFPGLQIRLETEKERDLKTYKMLFNQ
jgi:Leucine-rich repeat (LRR) protein